MLALARACAPEAVKGLATSLSLWAAKQHCNPVLHCPEFPRLPDCICQGDQRVCPAVEKIVTGACDWKVLVGFFVIGLAFGVYGKICYDNRNTTVGRPVAAAGEQIAQESSGEEYIQKAKRNKLQLKISKFNGAGNR